MASTKRLTWFSIRFIGQFSSFKLLGKKIKNFCIQGHGYNSVWPFFLDGDPKIPCHFGGSTVFKEKPGFRIFSDFNFQKGEFLGALSRKNKFFSIL